jgi:hypothetical protein
MFAAGFLLPTLLMACGGGGGTKPPDDEPGTPITVPLQTGNRWTYDVSVTVDAEPPENGSQVDSIVGVATVDGLSYWMIESRSDQEPPDTSYVRQSGQVVHIRPGSLPSGGGSPIMAWAARQLRLSLPWKVADFTSTKGEIASFEADTTFTAENLHLRLEINSANLGRTELQVPAGAYTDVYKGRLTQLLVGSQSGIVVVTSTTTLDLYVKDGVGVLQQSTVERIEQTGQSPLVTTTTASLRSDNIGP